jgi:hypothetical protein
MSKHRTIWIALVALLASMVTAAPSHAVSGAVRVTMIKAGLGVGAGAGRGVLTFRNRNYRFTVQGLSFGLAAGASVLKLAGRADYLNELSDFSGPYTVVGAGGALVGGVGGVQLKNDKGVLITLQGPRVGLELAANVSTVVIILYPSRSTPG